MFRKFILLTILAFSLTACGQSQQSAQPPAAPVPQEEAEAPADEQEETGSGTIVLGTSADFPPFEYYEGSEIDGFDIAICRKVAEKLGKELVIEDITFDGLIAALEAGKIDFVAAGMTRDAEREKSVDFSDGYYLASQVIIVETGNTEITGRDTLSGKKIGVQLGTTGDSYVDEMAAADNTITLDRYKAGYAAIMDLQAGKLDAVVIDSEPAKSFVNASGGKLKILDEMLTEEEYSLAVQKGSAQLLEAINSVIQELKDSGEYDALIEQYFK